MGCEVWGMKVWQKSHELVLEVYKVTQQFPNDEKVGLISQIRRSAVSVVANIAEGYKRQHLNKIPLKSKTRGGEGVRYAV